MSGAAPSSTGAQPWMAALAGAALLAAPAALAQSKANGWTEIPTRISGVSLRIQTSGCKDGICTFQVASSVPGDPISTEAINCKTSQIQTLAADNRGPWLRIDPGSVNEAKYHAVCHGR